MTTIGVAIAVPEPWGGALQHYRSRLGDVQADGIPTHVTLLPPVEVQPEQMADVEEHLLQVSGLSHAFRMHLRGTGTFRPVSPVVFVTVAEGIAGCEQLALGVRRGPLAFRPTFPYHPHVTVAHHQPEAVLDRAFEELAGFECAFLVDRFSLYVHHPADGWAPTHHFALSAGAAG